MIEGDEPFRYVATADCDAWSVLRTRLYLDSSLISESDLASDGLFHDDYEERSENYFIETGAGLRIGTFRIIDGRLGALQIADQFGIATEPNSYEISGFAVGPAYRTSGVSIGVYRACYRIALEEQFSNAYMEVEGWLLNSLERMGFPARVIGDPRWTFNATNYAVAISIPQVVPSLRAADAARGGRTRYGDSFAEAISDSFDPRDVFVSLDDVELPA